MKTTRPTKKSSPEPKKSTQSSKSSFSGESRNREPSQYTKLVSKLVRDINKNGCSHPDYHLDRVVQDLAGHFIVIKNLPTLVYLSTVPLLEKYKKDWGRMIPSFQKAVATAKKDRWSRQLMVFNDKDFDKVKQCFTHMQFMLTHRGEYDLYVYQRAADLVKLKDDLAFFAMTAREFETRVHIAVRKIVVVYGSIHYEIKK